MEKVLDYLYELITTVGVNILFGLIVLIVGFKLTKVIVKLIAKGHAFGKLEPSVQTFIRSFLRIVLYALVISSTAIIWGIPSTSFMTIFASAGVAIGLALQGALANFAGGLMILLFKPFKVGDYIEHGTKAGTVKEITVIYTTLTTPDNKQIIIPNGTLTNSEVVNYSSTEILRMDLTFSAAYDNDVEKVKSLLLKAAVNNPLVLGDPEPTARLNEHNSSSLDYMLRVWCKSADYWALRPELMESVKKLFDENDIAIPFPQMDVHLKQGE